MGYMKTKTCFKCNTTQTIDNFYKHPMMGDGYLGKCKTCNKQDVKDNYAKRRAQYSEYEARRNQDPDRKQRKRDYENKHRERNPDKAKARYVVGNAVRDGRLERLPCEVCGDPKSQGHHDDYSKPLDVRWLCFTHHREHHGQIVTIIDPKVGN